MKFMHKEIFKLFYLNLKLNVFNIHVFRLIFYDVNLIIIKYKKRTKTE